MDNVQEVQVLLSDWEREDNAGRDVTPILTRLAEVFELETQIFLKQDPDPFDDRHPSRSQPDCTLGHILKTVLRNQRIVDEMVKVYSQRDVFELNTAMCRFLLDILLGLENVIFQEEAFVLRLFQWAENAPNPLQTYATGLLAAAMEVPEIASSYREKNAFFVPLMLKRLKELSKSYLRSVICDEGSTPSTSFGSYESIDEAKSPASDASKDSHQLVARKKKESSKARYNPIYSETKQKEKKSPLKIPPVDESIINESSNSNWTEYMVGSYQVYPLTLAAEQRYILQYLTPMGEYQELIGHVFEENALSLILRYIDLDQNHDIRLAFEALKYLASLLCHKKVAIEFLNIGGLQLLLRVPHPSIAAAGVSFCFYYLGYLEEALEKICMSSPSLISDLVSYALWLLECSHDSSRCHATLFFGFAFAFKVILQKFDEQDGLRKLFNVMSTLDLFVVRNARSLSDDEVFANRLTTRHVCLALKKYFEAHLAILVEEKRASLSLSDEVSHLDVTASKTASLTNEAVERNIEVLHELSLIPFFHWNPVNEFVNLDGITFLLELISSYFDTSYSGRAETVKNALDVLKVCSLTAPATMKFLERISSPETLHITGISVLLQAAEGEMMPVAEVQRSALVSIMNCVCSKVPVAESGTHSAKKRVSRHVEDMLSKVWKAVRIKNGIIVLINLLSIKTPLTDADAIRVLACKALCGLARSQNVQQIVSKLPLVTGGQLIDLMKEPVLQDKYNDHVQFCKYGLELIQRVTGAPISAGSEYSLNLNKICVSEVVAKTKVIYHEHQLLQLICNHLKEKGFDQTASCLEHEMAKKSVASSSLVSLGAFPCVLNKSMETNAFGSSAEKTGRSSGSSCGSIPPPSVPLKIVLSKKFQSPVDIKSPRSRRLQKPQMSAGSYIRSPAISKKHQSPVTSTSSLPKISLDSIVVEYLRKQHALCKTPMLACPPFDLFMPHKCPEPHFKRNAPTNFALRIQKREISFQDGGYRGAALNTKHIYSRFRLYRSIRDEDGTGDFTTCAFFNNNEDPFTKLLVGTMSGQVKLVNIQTSRQLLAKDCHFRGIQHIESRESSPLFITSDGGRIGNSSLWNLPNMNSELELLNNFIEISHMEFGKRSLERIIATKQYSAAIIDTATFRELQTFPVENLGNNYMRNRATFDFSDELVLSDGLIYDVRSGKMLHKLDKFNSTRNGVFHPNGREIISNTEIWDIRTFKLLRTVAGLDQCVVTFNNPGTVMYAVSLKAPGDLSHITPKMCCFNTFDACDYSTIATVDLKKPVFHVAPDINDRYLSTVESVNGLECMCRIYEVGRTKQAGDENGDESDDSDDEEEETEGDADFDENEGQENEGFFDTEEENDNDDVNWFNVVTDSSDDDDDDDDDEVLFSLNTSLDE